MARAATRHICQSCGAAHPRWAGRCDACGAWNSIVEEVAPETVPTGGKASKKASSRNARNIEFVSLDGQNEPAPRKCSGIGEFDRVAGGGLVPGSALLIGGDPGIGKSTLLLQAVAGLASVGARCVYISGEESIDQVRMRAKRLAVQSAPVTLASATNVRDVLATLDTDDAPDIVVIDSIQTMYIDSLAIRTGHRQPGSRIGAGTDPALPSAVTSRCCLSGMSPRKA